MGEKPLGRVRDRVPTWGEKPLGRVRDRVPARNDIVLLYVRISR